MEKGGANVRNRREKKERERKSIKRKTKKYIQRELVRIIECDESTF